MTTYKNVSGVSDVSAYEVQPDRISVMFTDGWVFVYPAERLGKALFQEMIRYAEAGAGLHRFILTTARKKYSECFPT